jgi:hypothetical protein
MRRFLLVALVGVLATSGCAVGRPVVVPEFREITLEDIDLVVQDRGVVRSAGGEPLLRVRFSFASWVGFFAGGDTARSSGAVYFPVDDDGTPDPTRVGEVVLTEFPPGASASGLAIHPEYGERPAVELGVAAAVVDLRGPIVRDLRPHGLASEEQLAFTRLFAFQESGDPVVSYEHGVAVAWLRAMRALEEILGAETGVTPGRFLLAGESWGAAGAAAAAAREPRVQGLVFCGWPLDAADLHFTRWRRWERQARWFPLEEAQPIPYADSRAVLSFLISTFRKPDPGCPSCRGGGALWRSRFDYLELLRAGELDGVETLVLVGDSDPRFPVDLEARASLPDGAMEVEPSRAVAEVPFNPPFADLCYLRGAHSTLANEAAAEAVLAWIQHLAGYRDVPAIRLFETLEEGDVRIDVVVRGGNAAVTGVELWLTEIEDRRNSDFKWAAHLAEPEPMRWRRVDALFDGPVQPFGGRWRAYFPVDLTRNRAYYVVVRDRVGNLEAAHSLPARAMWNLGDPAAGPVRF